MNILLGRENNGSAEFFYLIFLLKFFNFLLKNQISYCRNIPIYDIIYLYVICEVGSIANIAKLPHKII